MFHCRLGKNYCSTHNGLTSRFWRILRIKYCNKCCSTQPAMIHFCENYFCAKLHSSVFLIQYLYHQNSPKFKYCIHKVVTKLGYSPPPKKIAQKCIRLAYFCTFLLQFKLTQLYRWYKNVRKRVNLIHFLLNIFAQSCYQTWKFSIAQKGISFADRAYCYCSLVVVHETFLPIVAYQLHPR